jgi:hypothetical protein
MVPQGPRRMSAVRSPSSAAGRMSLSSRSPTYKISSGSHGAASHPEAVGAQLREGGSHVGVEIVFVKPFRLSCCRAVLPFLGQIEPRPEHLESFAVVQSAAMIAPNTAEKVWRGTPSQSAHVPYSLVSFTRHSPTSNMTALIMLCSV